jgi:hypothetical protein
MKTSCFGDRKANKNWTLLSQWSIYAVAMNAVYDPWPFIFVESLEKRFQKIAAIDFFP